MIVFKQGRDLVKANFVKCDMRHCLARTGVESRIF